MGCTYSTYLADGTCRVEFVGRNTTRTMRRSEGNIKVTVRSSGRRGLNVRKLG